MGLSVIGVGLGRTGTASLKVALEHLGFGPCYHMAEAMKSREAQGLWIDAANGSPDWDKIFDGYGSTTDYPACNYWRELADRYPDAKLLLTTRSVESWIDSTQGTFFSPEAVELAFNSPLAEFFQKTTLGHGARMHDREYMRRYFRDHEDQIKRAFPADRLLVYEVTQGWEPLCEFLDVPVPDIPFPHVNSREEFSQMLAAMKAGHGGDAAADRISEHVGEVFVDRKDAS